MSWAVWGCAPTLRHDERCRWLASTTHSDTVALHLAAHSLQDEQQSPILALHLNHNTTAFGAATTNGWHLYHTNPLKLIIKRGTHTPIHL